MLRCNPSAAAAISGRTPENRKRCHLQAQQQCQALQLLKTDSAEKKL
jgi:hypothetical protein